MGLVRLYSTLRERTGGAPAVEVPWSTGGVVADVLRELVRRAPGLDGFILDEDGLLLRYVIVFVDGRDVRHLNGLETALEPGAEVVVFPPIAGGRR